MIDKETHKELFVNTTNANVEIALQEDGKLVEFHREFSGNEFTVGNIYVGRVKKILHGLNAAFIDIGHQKDAFLHYLDLGVKVKTINKFVKNRLQNNPDYLSIESIKEEEHIAKKGNIKDVLTVNQLILVQIIKEPISTKGPRVSGDIALAGRFLVFIPFSNQLSVSQKIKNEAERDRLKKIITKYHPKNVGIIIRTIAENKNEEDIYADFQNLSERWNQIIQNINGIKFPKKVASELNRIGSFIRDLLNDTFDAIHINDVDTFKEVREFMKVIAPERIDIIKLYQKSTPLFEHYGIDKQIRTGFGKIVAIKSGIYLVIEHTEALNVIDVNSGHRINAFKSQEENILAVNLEAATEIARQLRLRDIGGIIIIDFIDMRSSENQKILHKRLKEEMKKDRACHTILPPNKFGLVHITRERVRPSADIEPKDKCPTCQGSGKIKTSHLFYIDEIEAYIEFLVEKQQEKKLTLITHPFIHAYLTKGFFNWKRKWQRKYHCKLTICSDETYSYLEYRFFNDTLGEINIWTYIQDKSRCN
ncbi:MAG: Rne/Rng family ribonuclease [Bacteroidales bacterium]|jgi:ribonuclease G|nr:Rne/Rng family ribonuclease [Bacteroidales bacterium]